MGWQETNERNAPRLQGQAGVYRVASELLLRGFNPQFPAVDCGADLVVEGGVRVQVKCGHLRQASSLYPQGAYWFKLTRGPTAHGNHGVRPRAPRVFSRECDFVVFWGIEQHRFWIVPSALLDGKSLLVLGPDVAWADLNVPELRELKEQGLTNQQIGERYGVSASTIGKRLAGVWATPVEARALTYKVRACEGKWDSIRSCVELATEKQPIAVTTAEMETANCQQIG